MGITVQDRLLRMADVVGEAGASLMVQQTLDVPADHPEIERIIGVNAAPVVTEAVAEGGRVVVRGKASLSLIYAAVSGPEAESLEYDAALEPAEVPAPESIPDQYEAVGDDLDWAHRRSHREHDEHREEHEEHEEHRERPRRHRRHHLHCIHFEESVAFEAEMDIADVSAGMTVMPEVMVEHVAHNLVNRRRCGVDVSLVVKVKVDRLVECKAVIDVIATPPDRVHVKREKMHLHHVVADDRHEREVEAVVVLPAAKPDLVEVAEVEAMAKGVTARVEDGRVVVEGTVDVGLMYTCDLMGMLPMHHVRMPEAGRFSHTMMIAGVRAGHMAQVHAKVIAVTDVSHDQRAVRVVVKLRIRVRVSELHNVEVITDVTSDTREIDVRKQMVHFEDPIGEGGREALVAGTLNLPPTKPPIDTIVKAQAVFAATELRAADGKAVVEGDLSFRIVYVGSMADQPVHVVEFPKGMHMAQQVDIPGLRAGMKVDADVMIQALEVECVDPDTLQVKAMLKIKVQCAQVVQIELVCEFVIVSPCPPGTSMRLIVVQPGDTLWKISRRFGTTVEEIARLNRLVDVENIAVGMRLKIPCVAIGPIVGKG